MLLRSPIVGRSQYFFQALPPKWCSLQGLVSISALPDHCLVLSAVCRPQFFQSYQQRSSGVFFSFFFFFSDADNSRLEKAPASRSRRWLHTCHPPLPWKSRGSARRAGRGTRVHVCENVTSFIFKRAMRDCLFFQDTSRLFVLQILLTLLHCSSSLHTLIYSYANRQLCLQ